MSDSNKPVVEIGLTKEEAIKKLREAMKAQGVNEAEAVQILFEVRPHPKDCPCGDNTPQIIMSVEMSRARFQYKMEPENLEAIHVAIERSLEQIAKLGYEMKPGHSFMYEKLPTATASATPTNDINTKKREN